MASLSNLPRAPHLQLHATFSGIEPLRPDVRELAVRTAPREDSTIEIARYGAGRMSIVVA